MKTVLSCLFLFLLLASLSGCSRETADPGEPPLSVLTGEPSSVEENVGDEAAPPDAEEESPEALYAFDGTMMENAVTVRIGRGGRVNWAVDLCDTPNAAVMLSYLSSDALLFPTYSYDGEAGYVAQSIRGSYDRGWEETVSGVKAGEVYILNGSQLRLYFRDAPDTELTGIRAGQFQTTDGLEEAVTGAYEENLGDIWGVDVYFWLTGNKE